MKITVHDTLRIQWEIWQMPAAERRPAIQTRLLPPFEGMLRIMTGGRVDPLALLNLPDPEGPSEAPLAALDELEAAGALDTCREALERASAAFAPTGFQLPVDEIHFGLFLMSPNGPMAALAQDYTGFGGIPGWITVNLWPNGYNLPRLGACTVHEFNHQVRLSFEPWRMDISLGEYIVMEGLAESFSAELFGPEKVGPWVAGVTGEDLATARGLIGGQLGLRGFNEVRSYLYGDGVVASMGGTPVGMPNYGGYAVGYHLVQAYLRRTGKTVAEATLTPSAEILQGSDYFHKN